MSLQMYMKIDGVDGDVRSGRHRGWSEVLSWSWGMTSNRKRACLTDADNTTLNEISVVKPLSGDSAAIRALFVAGSTVDTVRLSVLPPAVKRQVARRYVDLTLGSVVIKSVVTGGGIDDTFFKEHVCLLFECVSFEFSRYPEADESRDDPEPRTSTFGWNVTGNLEWVAPVAGEQ